MKGISFGRRKSPSPLSWGGGWHRQMPWPQVSGLRVSVASALRRDRCLHSIPSLVSVHKMQWLMPKAKRPL